MSLPKPTNVFPIDLPEQNTRELPFLPDYGDKGKVLNTSDNLKAVLNHNQWRARYNMMTADSELCTVLGSCVGGSNEVQRSMLVDACQRSGVPTAAIEEHLARVSQCQSYHPVREWLETGPQWDGKLRVADVLSTLNATVPDYAASVLRTWLVGCVAALYAQRWQLKLVPVLLGGQSFKKSAWVNRLAAVVEGSTLDCSIDPAKSDDVRRAISSWVVELAELESTTKHEVGSLKAFLTREIDRLRLPYARTFTKKVRQTAFIATVNGTNFLKDPTGNIRFAVIEMVAPADIGHLNELLGWQWSAGRLRQSDPELLRQFWLEVKAAYDAGESWILDDATIQQAAKANDMHTDKGPHYEAIVDWHLSRQMKSSRWFTAADLCSYHSEKSTMAGRYGRALKQLAEEGKIKARALGGRRNEYLLPVN